MGAVWWPDLDRHSHLYKAFRWNNPEGFFCHLSDLASVIFQTVSLDEGDFAGFGIDFRI